MAPIARNAPCPCGSGRKYKKCCLGKSEPAAPAQASVEPVFAETDSDALSNQANALIRQRKWAAAQAICERLRTEFPDEIDADDRLAQLHAAQEQWASALVHAQAALDKARRHPEKFDPELVGDLEEHIVFLKSKAAP